MRRQSISTLCAAILTAAIGASAVAQESITSIVRQVRPAVVTVITYDKDGEKDSQGSGFFVDANHVVTDWHVIEDAGRIEVKGADGKVYRVTSVVAGGESDDLAKLELSESNTNITPLKITGVIPEAGERVVVVGSPFGLDATVSDGIVSGVRDIPGLGRVIQISAPISRGSSGSPVVNLKGEVVGVAQAIRGGGQNLNFAIPGAQVLAMKPTGSGARASKPADAGAGPTGSADDLFASGLTLFRSKSYDRALPYFLDTVKQDPRHYLAWFLAGHCYINMDRYKEAAAAFMESVQVKPDFVDGYCSLGAALGLMGRHDLALEAFNMALKIDPKSATAHYGLGLAYLGLKQRDRAMAEYRVLQTLDPDLAAHLGELLR